MCGNLAGCGGGGIHGPKEIRNVHQRKRGKGAELFGTIPRTLSPFFERRDVFLLL